MQTDSLINTYSRLKKSYIPEKDRPNLSSFGNSSVESRINLEIQACFYLFQVNFEPAIERAMAKDLFERDLTEILSCADFSISPPVSVLLFDGSQYSHSLHFEFMAAQKMSEVFSKKIPNTLRLLPLEYSQNCILEGGSCSAMTLSFFARYIELSKKNDDILSVFETIMKTHSCGNAIFLSMQAAMNQIALVNQNMNPEWAAEEKAQGLASFFNLNARPVGPFSPFTKESLAAVDSLGEGVYFIRAIKLNTSKPSGESYGHSLGFIRRLDRANDCYYYDPNIGIIKPVSSIIDMLHSSLLDCDSCFDFDGYKIYEITETPAPSLAANAVSKSKKERFDALVVDAFIQAFFNGNPCRYFEIQQRFQEMEACKIQRRKILDDKKRKLQLKEQELCVQEREFILESRKEFFKFYDSQVSIKETTASHNLLLDLSTQDETLNSFDADPDENLEDFHL